MYYAVSLNDDDFGLVGFASNRVEQIFIATIGVILLFTAFDMFLMSHCRKHTRQMMRCQDDCNKTYVGLMSVNK